LGVKEYFLFDPDQEYLDPPFQGHQLIEGAYKRLEAGDAGCLISAELRLRLCAGEGQLQFYRLDTGERLLTARERVSLETQRAEQESQRAEREAKARQLEAERANREANRRQLAELEVARLREELARRRTS
jgi:hypothetical protein